MWKHDYKDGWSYPFDIEKCVYEGIYCPLNRKKEMKISFPCSMDVMNMTKAWVIKDGSMEHVPEGFHVITIAEYEAHEEGKEPISDVEEDTESEEEMPEPVKNGRPIGRVAKAAAEPAAKRARKAKAAKIVIEADESDEDEPDDDDMVSSEGEDEDLEEAEEADEFVLGRGGVIHPEPFDQKAEGRRSFDWWKNMTPYQIFMRLFKPMADWVVKCTNINIGEDPRVAPIEIGELLIWVAITIYFGLIILPNVEAFWYPKSYSKIATLIDIAEKMTFTRCKQIKAKLRFNVYEDVTEATKEGDKVWKFRPMLNLIQQAFKNIMLAPLKCLSMDEAMVKILSKRFPCLIHQPNKPIDTGAQFYCLVDHETKICINLEMADGMLTPDMCAHMPWKTNGERVLRLVRGLCGVGYWIFTDNYYTGIPLARELLRLGMYLCGTVRKARTTAPELVASFGTAKTQKPTRALPKGTWNHAGNTAGDIMLHGYMDNSAVYLLDTISGTPSAALNRRSGTLITTYEAPLSLTWYNTYMNGVDVWDQLRTHVHYSTESTGRNQKWTTILFLSFISMCTANAYCIYRAHHPDGLTHNEFQIELFTFLWNNEYWNVGQPIGRPVMLATKHEPTRLPKGSRGQSGVNRHRGVCKGCVGDSTTSWYCNVCKVFLHPECMEKFHAKVPFRAPKKDAAIVEKEV